MEGVRKAVIGCRLESKNHAGNACYFSPPRLCDSS